MSERAAGTLSADERLLARDDDYDEGYREGVHDFAAWMYRQGDSEAHELARTFLREQEEGDEEK